MDCVVVEPPAVGVTMPTPLSSENFDAPFVVQVSEVFPPGLTLLSAAESVHARPDGGGTVTAAVQVAVWPSALVTVPVKVVSLVIAEVDALPLASGVTAPMPWLITKVFAFVVVHESFEVSPLLTFVGDAESVQVGALGVEGIFTTIFAVQVTVVLPSKLVAVPV
jgi:hypothetical protein